MKINYKLEAQLGTGKDIQLNSLIEGVDNYLSENKFVKKNTEVYFNVEESNVYIVEKKNNDTVRQVSCTFKEIENCKKTKKN